MTDIIVIASILLVALVVVGQYVWTQHQQEKVNKLQQHFMYFVSEFNKGMWQTDAPRYREFLAECISLERLCVDAQIAVRSEIWVYPWRWFLRWNVDYFAEQKITRPRYYYR